MQNTKRAFGGTEDKSIPTTTQNRDDSLKLQLVRTIDNQIIKRLSIFVCDT